MFSGDTGNASFDERVWLELDPLAEQISIPSAASNDLLDQLRRGFSLEPIMNSRVEAELRWFVRNPDQGLMAMT